ncbi:MAG TPA: Fic family protein [Polyangiaceae bacterium]|nr:Fic family protein [Polyangiaceae bacterium]
MTRKAFFTKETQRISGTWVKQGTDPGSYEAFVPAPLPPEPPVQLDPSLANKLQKASLALGRLDGIGRLLRGPEELLYSYVRKEAVLSSQIEGTQSSFADLVLHENHAAPGVPLNDLKEVSNYIDALNHGLKLLEELPVSLRLIRAVHEKLVAGTRGENQTPGEFRRSQNWIGGTRPGNAKFVPPPPHEVLPSLSHLEKFIHSRDTPTLIKVAFVHVQFETIHPFLDGNGRVGRMLIPLILVAEGLLERPWLYVSLHFKRRRSEYYDLLQRVRTHGDWESWLHFYLDGIAIVAEEAVEKIRELLELFESDRRLVESSRGGSIYQQAALRSNILVYDLLKKRIAIRIPEAAQELGSSKPTVTRALDELQKLGIAHEVTGKSRGKIFAYRKYMDILNRDTVAENQQLQYRGGESG